MKFVGNFLLLVATVAASKITQQSKQAQEESLKGQISLMQILLDEREKYLSQAVNKPNKNIQD